MRRRTGIVLCVATLAAAAVLVFAAMAFGGTPIPTAIDVTGYSGTPNSETVKGVVTSDKAACERDRVVKYYLDFGTGSGFELQGKTKTKDDGSFKLKDIDNRQGGMQPEMDRATTPAKFLSHSGDTCEAATETNG